jgi:uncharacterized membrane protein
MIEYSLDWLELAARWFHLIVGAAWIGTSFYFNWLNNSIRAPEAPVDGVSGTLWAIHGGGFYQVTKYKGAPDRLPSTLHWFKWEAYLTWVSGVSLLCLVYYLGSDGTLLPTGSTLSRSAGAGIGLGLLLVGWVAYDQMCKSSLKRSPVLFSLVGFVGLVAISYALMLVFTPRAAYLHVGALIGTCMAANVFFVIIPGQRSMVNAMTAGDEPDPADGEAGSLRSLHNNYLTLPVLFIMISTHYPSTYAHPMNWMILAAVMMIGALTRHWFNLRGKGQNNRWILPVAAVAFIGLAVLSKPESSGPGMLAEGEVPVDFYSQVYPIILSRCASCHGTNHPLSPPGPPKGLVWETAASIKANLKDIERTALTKDASGNYYMPLGNITQMTEAEREVIRKWIAQGAPMGKAK